MNMIDLKDIQVHFLILAFKILKRPAEQIVGRLSLDIHDFGDLIKGFVFQKMQGYNTSLSYRKSSQIAV